MGGRIIMCFPLFPTSVLLYSSPKEIDLSVKKKRNWPLRKQEKSLQLCLCLFSINTLFYVTISLGIFIALCLFWWAQFKKEVGKSVHALNLRTQLPKIVLSVAALSWKTKWIKVKYNVVSIKAQREWERERAMLSPHETVPQREKK